MTMTVVQYEKSGQVPISLVTEVSHVERDSDEYITVYGTDQSGLFIYLILSQETVDRIKSV